VTVIRMRHEGHIITGRRVIERGPDLFDDRLAVGGVLGFLDFRGPGIVVNAVGGVCALWS
jgi:hypothetical protein